MYVSMYVCMYVCIHVHVSCVIIYIIFELQSILNMYKYKQLKI